jgi:hypothetical protein
MASAERKPARNVARSFSVKERTKIGSIMSSVAAEA